MPLSWKNSPAKITTKTKTYRIVSGSPGASGAAILSASRLCNNIHVLISGLPVQARFTAAEILGQLDDCALKFEFPMLDNGNVYPADVRLHAYADLTRWAIVIEDLGYHFRAGQHDGITNCVSYYGNCLLKTTPDARFDYLTPTSDAPSAATFRDDVDTYLRRPVGEIKIRDQIVDYDCSPENLGTKNIATIDEPTGTELLRTLITHNRNLLFATEEELRKNIPFNLPQILQLEEWYHPDLANDDLPSANETFQQIALVLCHSDASKYSPTRAANTHWSNWPYGGTL